MKPSPLPPVVPTPSFSVGEARAADVSKRRLRASDLASPFYGVRSVQFAMKLEDRCRAYQARMAEDQFFSHVTAAALCGLPLPRRLEPLPLIEVSGRRQRPRLAGVRGYRAQSTPTLIVRGFPVTAPAFLLAELTSALDFDELVVAADAIARRRHPLAPVEELRSAAMLQTSRGIRSVREALVEARSGTDSPMETRLRLLIVRAGLPEPVIHHTIYDAAGDFVGTPDLAYVRERIAIEYEGAGHRDDPAIFADDIERRELMQEAGWYVIRVIADHVFRNPTWLTIRIRRALLERRV